MRKLLTFTASVVVLLLALLILALNASRVDPVVFEPAPNRGLTGDFERNEDLAAADRLLVGVGIGPEDIAPGPDGWLYTGYRDGRIVRFRPDGAFEAVADTNGVPLGLRVLDDGTLVVADAMRGLLEIAVDGTQNVLVDAAVLTFIDGLDIGADGRYWFTDASDRYRYGETMYIFLEGRRTGRLLSYSPESGDIVVHLDDLFFGNGVAVGPDDLYVLVAETAAGNIRRYWLEGDNAGTSDLFFEGLPGAPDNLSIDDDGIVWVGIAGLRDPKFEELAGKPMLRKVLGALPPRVLLPPGRHNMIIGIAADGSIAYNLQSSDGPFTTTTAALRIGDHLYIGSLGGDAVGVMSISGADEQQQGSE